MLSFLSPAGHLSAPHYNFIFHIMLPDGAIGSVRSLVPGLYDLSIPFKLHATSAPQNSKTRWPWPEPGPGQRVDIFSAAAPAREMLRVGGGGWIKATPSITQVALGEEKTSLATPGLLTLPHTVSTQDQSTKLLPHPCLAKYGLFPTSHFPKARRRRESCLKASLIKGLVPACQSTPH